MTSSRRAALALLVASAIFSAPRCARADVDASKLHLDYDVLPGCPSRSEFIAALSTRIQSSWLEGADTRSFDVHVQRTPDGKFVGRLQIGESEDPSSTREIRSKSCKAVMTSLAVFIAIALDPASESTPERSVPAAEEKPVVPPMSEPRVIPPPIRDPALRTRGPAAAPESNRTRWTLHAGYAASYTRVPDASWGGRVHAELSRGRPGARWTPAVRASWGWSDFATPAPLGGEAQFRFKSARVEAGPRLALGRLFFGAFAGVDVGSLTGAAPDLPRSLPFTTGWVAASGALRGAIAILPWLAVELSIGALVPLERKHFVLLEPTRVVYRVPVVLLEGSAGIAASARF
jgi:hypothetical protein